MMTGRECIWEASELLGDGVQHQRGIIIKEAAKIYSNLHPDAKTPEKTISAIISRGAGWIEFFDDGTILVSSRDQTIEKENEQIDIDAQYEYELERDIYPVLSKCGWIIIANMRGNPKLMNPDAFKIYNRNIISCEVKNKLTLSDYALAIAETTTNGLWACGSTLVYISGPDKDLEVLSKASGIGLCKLVGEKIIDIVPPEIRKFNSDVAKRYYKNDGIRDAIFAYTEILQ